MQRHPDRSHALLYLDIDKLHVVNDTFGHMAGDQVIRAESRIIDELAGRDDAVSHPVAEHVENDLIIQRLRHHGIDFLQGFAVGKPRPLADVLQDMGPPVMLGKFEELVSEGG